MKRKPIEAYICFLFLAVMTLCMTMEVTARYIFGFSFVWVEELTRYLFIWFIFISASYAVIEKAHIKADSFVGIFPVKIRPFIMLLGGVIWLTFSLFVAYQGVKYALPMIQAGSKSPAMGVPTGIVYLGIPIGYFLMSVRLFVQIIGELRKSRNGKEETPPAMKDDTKIVV